MLDFQIFIATYNRPDLICNTIDSILLQKDWDFELIISDNSTNNETAKIVQEKYGNSIRYIKRETSVNVITHLNLILDEVDKDYFMIFHDDDTMRENMLLTIKNAFLTNPSLVAIGSNAKTIKNNETAKTWFLKDEETDHIISNATEMARRYLEPNQIVPFPSYVYKGSIAKKLKFDITKGGKYSDVAFIIDVARFGNVLFLSKPLMNYFIHNGQDSFTNDFTAKLKLTRYILKNTTISKDDKALAAYRLNNIYRENLADRRFKIMGLLSKRALILITKKDYLSFIKLSFLTVSRSIKL